MFCFDPVLLTSRVFLPSELIADDGVVWCGVVCGQSLMFCYDPVLLTSRVFLPSELIADDGGVVWCGVVWCVASP